LQPVGFLQIPTEKPAWISQTTLPSPGKPLPAAPQQSASFVQRSPSMWQPSAGWQIFTPDVPYGAQSRLQQSPHPLHTVPSKPPLQKLAPAGGAPQVPSVAPAAIVQTPPQQSGPCEQVSPLWMQKEDAIEQWPEAQSFEQHSELCAHALPDVLHDLLSAVQLPPEHVPLQQSALAEHACPSETQVCVAHWPPTQESEQQSSDVLHVAPAASQLTGAPPMHALARGSQRPEQHSTSLAQWDPEPTQRLVPPNPNPPSADTLPDAPPHPLERAATIAPTTSAASA
jgi:hypothetical protein